MKGIITISFFICALNGFIIMAAEIKLDLKAVLDGLGQGVLVFGSDGRLVLDNLAARTILGKDFNMLRTRGWDAASALFNARQTDPDLMIDAVRARALESARPVRFHIYLSGEYVPCWAAALQAEGGEMCIMLTLEVPDWSSITMLVDTFRREMNDAIQSTQGHVDLIDQTIKHHKPEAGVETLIRRVKGFTRLISVHMHRVGRLNAMLERLEDMRTGRAREIVRQHRRKIVLEDFFEDFVEELDEIMLVDPETEAQNHRARLALDIPEGIAAAASTSYLKQILQDILRNAIMYSIRATPITISAQVKGQSVQFDVTDEGYGIREKERERVFEAFKRARQPQIISEFGYGLSLYLCKHEVEAMNGRMWFESTEGVGSTFSFMLPVWQDDNAATSSSDSQMP